MRVSNPDDLGVLDTLVRVSLHCRVASAGVDDTQLSVLALTSNQFAAGLPADTLDFIPVILDRKI